MKISILISVLLYSCVSYSKFVDKIKDSGIDFVHINGMSGEYYLPEIMGGGAAFLDYDNDGDMDVYIVQSGYLPNSKNSNNLNNDRLYRNDTKIKNQPVFVDVTKQAGINSKGYGMGVSAADLNNDGFTDLFISNFEANQILMNNGDGTFSVSKNALPETDKNWSVSASITDFNRDGYLDIFVVNYTTYPKQGFIKQCKAFDGSLDYCSPQAYKYQSDYLYKNNKNGTFTNISFKAGLSNKNGAGLGVVSADFNNDLKPDFYIANDGVDNHLWINKGNDEFAERGLASGVAVNMNGEPEASMGVDAADFDNDGDVDLFMTHLNRQTNTLYVNNGKGWFSDLTIAKKLSSSSYIATGFGTIWFDYNNDGQLDLFSANGAVVKIKKDIIAKDPFPYKQSNQIWKNIGNGQYQEVTKEQGSSFLRKDVSRGAAFADIDNDGDLDVLVLNNNSIPQLLINENTNDNHWIGLKLYDKSKKRVDVGALVRIEVNGNNIQRRVKTDGSYESSHDNRLLIGLGSNKDKVSIEVLWTDGTKKTYNKLDSDQYHILYR
jgi:hypothetical protein